MYFTEQFAICAFILLVVFTISLQQDCNQSEECEEKTSKYDQVSNEIFEKISAALKSYKSCSKDDCACHEEVINNDLKPFHSGITKSMIDAVADRGTRYQIIDKKLYRQKDCMFPSRCSGVEHFVKKFLNKTQNFEVIINSRDWPQIHRNFGKNGPVFSFSKTNEYLDIMYPTWSFWEGGPAISLYPTGLGRWDEHRISITEAAKKWTWDDKMSKGFFRGSRTSDERDSLVLLSRKYPDLVDAQYTKNQAWKSMKDTLNAEPVKEISLEDHCQYKFLFNFRGVAASFRFKHLFLCKSLVFHVGDEWKEFFYDSMVPWVHYVPLKSLPTEEDLRKIIAFFKEHDDLAREIAERGYQYIWDHLRMEDVDCYWEKLIDKYSKLLTYDVELDKSLIEIK